MSGPLTPSCPAFSPTAARRQRWDIDSLERTLGVHASQIATPTTQAHRSLLGLDERRFDEAPGDAAVNVSSTGGLDVVDTSSTGAAEVISGTAVSSTGGDSSDSSTGVSVPSSDSSTSAVAPQSSTGGSAPSASGPAPSSLSAPPSTVPGRIHLVDYSDYMYIGMLGLGTPAQYFGCVFDTGSADTWVFSDAFTEEKYTWIHYFNSSASQTFQALPASDKDRSWHITYGKGAASGLVAQDTLWLGGVALEAAHVALVTATQHDPAFAHENEPIDGIFGLGFAQLATKPRMAVLPRADFGKPATFAFHMSSVAGQADDPLGAGSEDEISTADAARHPGSWFQLGPRDDTLAPHGFTSVPILDPTAPGVDGRWIIELGGMAVGNAEVPALCSDSSGAEKRCVAWVDTGSSFVLMPPARYAEVMSSIVSSRPDCTVTPCTPGVEGRTTCSYRVLTLLPTLSLNLGGRDFLLAPEMYILEDADVSEDGKTSTEFLQLGFGCAPASQGVDLWLLGDTFLKNYYTVFDMAAQEILVANTQGFTIQWWMVLLLAGGCAGIMAALFACIQWKYGPRTPAAAAVQSSSTQDRVASMLRRARGGYAHVGVDGQAHAPDIEMAPPSSNGRAEPDEDEALPFDEDDLREL